jgi:hypothetical protein
MTKPEPASASFSLEDDALSVCRVRSANFQKSAGPAATPQLTRPSSDLDMAPEVTPLAKALPLLGNEAHLMMDDGRPSETRLPGETAEFYSLRRTFNKFNEFLHSKGEAAITSVDWANVLDGIRQAENPMDTKGLPLFQTWLASLRADCPLQSKAFHTAVPTTGAAGADSPSPLSPAGFRDPKEAPCQESAGEAAFRLRINQGLRAKGRPELSRAEWVNTIRDVLSDHQPLHDSSGLKFCPGGHSYTPTPQDGTVEWCTFEFHRRTDDPTAVASITELRFLTTARVYEIRQHLSEVLAPNAWPGHSQPFLLSPGTEEILPCLLSARQVMALARGRDATSTPVDTIIYIKEDPSMMEPGPSDDLCCLSCRLACPAFGWDGADCHHPLQIQTRADEYEPKHPGPLWQI